MENKQTYSKEITTTESNRQSLIKAETLYIESISKGLKDIVGDFTKYQSVCGFNILQAINVELAKSGLTHSSNGVDRESINNAIKFASLYQLNTDNREVFVMVRNEKRKQTNGQEYWCKKIEVRPQYKGTLKIVATYGRDVEKIYPEWIVREGDDFSYATFKGVEVIPPTWTPKSSDGKVIRVVVPIQYKNGFIDYRIAERESVATNIKAQIKQALMSNKDTQTRIMTLIKDYTLDQLLSEKEIMSYINETYTGLSREEMIITKLILNATKRVAIDYSSALARDLLEETFDNSNDYKKKTAGDIIDNEIGAVEMKEPIVEEIGEQKEELEKVENKTERDIGSLFDDNGVVETPKDDSDDIPF